LAERGLFRSFFIGGFECSTHRPRSGRRLDLIAATEHDRCACADYARLREQGILAARDGIRWHLIERMPECYDFSSALPMVRAAHDAGVQVIWDLCHYGWPDDIDIFGGEFAGRFARMARAFAALVVSETGEAPIISPVNEISFFAWAGGEVAYINPLVEGRGGELKAQLVRAAIEGIEAVWEVAPGARVVNADPVLHISSDPSRPEDRPVAENYTRAQFEAWDMLAGRVRPELGGAEKYLDIVGVNYYPHNQWVFNNLPFNPAYKLSRFDPLYRPFRRILRDVYERYGRPMFVAETGSDDDDRPDWLRYICQEVHAAMTEGVQLEGICIYPIVNFPWWDDDFHLQNGLWDYPNEAGEREICGPLARELQAQRRFFEGAGDQEPARAADFPFHYASGPAEVV
jgi:beta-glucosidase/6-phospho-beta-glucosidase/beta-galactosidase